MATFRDRLSHLSFLKASKLLGSKGKTLITKGGRYTIDPSTAVELKRDVVRISLPDAFVSIIDDPAAINKMRIICSECNNPCIHMGAALSLILEEKTALGLAIPPPEDEETSALSETELLEREIARRIDRAQKERMRVRSMDSKKPWTDYTVYSNESGKTYRVALRGFERGQSYCSCPDFRKNTLGTCKHILRVSATVKRKFTSRKLKRQWKPDRLAVYIEYGADVQLRLQTPGKVDDSTRRRFKRFFDTAITDIPSFVREVSRYIADAGDILIYPDAERFIDLRLHYARISDLIADIRKCPSKHAFRTSLLKVELMPYQLEGIAFAVGAARAVLADDMGLGKTIQAIGTAELLARECNIHKTLIVCPASVKSQWCDEIARFSGRSSQIVAGSSNERQQQYCGDDFFTICNYEQVLRDISYIEKTNWDFIVLDEGQRIKNWKTKTSRTIKGLRSLYALVLTGTPLENRLEELYSVIEFIDDRRLGPDFRFQHEYRLSDDRGKTIGYDNLDSLRQKIEPILLRRTRKQILRQLPPRTNQVVRIPPTSEQLELHAAQMRIVTMIARKQYISEMDLLRLQKALLAARMSANSTFLVDKEKPGYSTKLERLTQLLPRIAAEEDRKAIVFSEWTTMLDLIENILIQHGITYVRLDGSVPQGKRAVLVREFNTTPDCRFFLATNTGATGLNLQAANTIVNVDLPWNPAVLEQRIGRAHRMGQKHPVHVYILITEQTIEENMLGTLAMKQELAIAALDPDSGITKVNMASGLDELKKRLEILLGEKPEAESDESEKHRIEEETERLARQHRLEIASGNLVTAAFSMLDAVLPQTKPDQEILHYANRIKEGFNECLERADDGSLTLKVRLSDATALDSICTAVAGLFAATKVAQSADSESSN